MSTNPLEQIIDSLPQRLHQDIDSYVSFVAEIAPEIYNKLSISMTPEAHGSFLFLAGLRRLWHTVSGHYRMLDWMLTTLERQGIERIVTGRTIYSKQSRVYHDTAALYREFDDLFHNLHLSAYVAAANLEELATMVHRRFQTNR